MVDNKLLPCPFCGGEAELSKREEELEYSEGVYYVGMEVACKCGALIIVYDNSRGFDPSGEYPANKQDCAKEAIKRWNTRTNP